MDHRRAVQGISARAGVGRMVLGRVARAADLMVSARAAQARAGLDLGEAVPAGLAGVDPVEVAFAP